ncbi:uncharacterized protein LOC132271943 [Cornus florida]|uniref:uncharacterized protein LOC132271943 n=1 Tax=Cornus florida TaxID=4283 RepID=UPI0028A2CE61|nr:uncharacterized protein LOC132271943 [Cornus florida]
MSLFFPTHEPETISSLNSSIGLQPSFPSPTSVTGDFHWTNHRLTLQILDKFYPLLATLTEIQKQHYEPLIAEAKSRRESSRSEAVEKAVASKMQDIQCELEKLVEVHKMKKRQIKSL